MSQILEIAAAAQQRAWDVVNQLKVLAIWSSIGARVNLVGSLKTGLLIQHRDIDFHIYTDPFSLSDSFSAMARLAANPSIESIRYKNVLQADDKCVEWHAMHRDGCGDAWRIDMIHMRSDSPYAGYFEKVAERISAVLTPETREAILTIKYAIPVEKKVKGIEVYRAVIAGGVRDERSFWEWRQDHAEDGIITWMP